MPARRFLPGLPMVLALPALILTGACQYGAPSVGVLSQALLDGGGPPPPPDLSWSPGDQAPACNPAMFEPLRAPLLDEHWDVREPPRALLLALCPDPCAVAWMNAVMAEPGVDEELRQRLFWILEAC